MSSRLAAPVAGARAEKSAPLAVASGVLAGGSETPFFSTTNNLTTEPHKSVSELPEYQEHQRLAHSMDRLRYLSQCPVRCCNRGRSQLERSRSCPRLREPSVRPKWPAEGSLQVGAGRLERETKCLLYTVESPGCSHRRHEFEKFSAQSALCRVVRNGAFHCIYLL